MVSLCWRPSAWRKAKTSKTLNWRHCSWESVSKQETWAPYELKPRNVERRFFDVSSVNNCFRGIKGSVIKNGFITAIPRKRKSWGLPGHASTSSPRPNIHAAKVMLWYLVGPASWCCLLWIVKTMRNHHWGIGIDFNCCDWAEHSARERPEYARRHKEVILQHDNAPPHVAKPVKTNLESLKWEILPHPPYFPGTALPDFHLFRSMVHGLAD